MSEYCNRFAKIGLEEAFYPMKLESVKVTIGGNDWILTEEGTKGQESLGGEFEQVLKTEFLTMTKKLPVKSTNTQSIENGIEIEWTYPHHLTVSNDDDVTWFGEDVLDYLRLTMNSINVSIISCTVTFKVYAEKGLFRVSMKHE